MSIENACSQVIEHYYIYVSFCNFDNFYDFCKLDLIGHDSA
jgi:hypothetical protein